MGGPASANNAALAQQSRFFCSGDVTALRDAESTLERAYRESPDDPVVALNLMHLLSTDAKLRVISKRVDVDRLRPGVRDVETLMTSLLAGSERDAVLAELAKDPTARRAEDLAQQVEVLAPNRVDGFQAEFDAASARNDEAGMRAAIAHMKNAKNLDRSETESQRAAWQAGTLDALLLEEAESRIAVRDELVDDRKVDAKTRAAAQLLAGMDGLLRAVLKADANAMDAALADLRAAPDAWPALADDWAVGDALIEAAALRAGSDTWVAARRLRSGPEVLAKLVADGDPLADKIRSSPEWAQVLPTVQASKAPPGLETLRIAQLLGDAAQLERAKAALTDPRTLLGFEAADLLDPDRPDRADDAALLGK
jgi:hypothetical protein